MCPVAALTGLREEVAGNLQGLLVTPIHLPSQTTINGDEEVRARPSSNHAPWSHTGF